MLILVGSISCCSFQAGITLLLFKIKVMKCLLDCLLLDGGRSRTLCIRKKEKEKEKGERSVMRFFRDSNEEKSGERICVIRMEEVV